jgi:mRNA-degrading endonuclease toxin of MazEF toxin-antitoxin module
MVELPAPIGKHPVVVVSPQKIIDEAGIKAVNALLCSSVRGSDRVGSREVYLDDADSLEGATGCQCHAMLLIPKQRFAGSSCRGSVSRDRQDQIRRKLRETFEL